MGRYLLAMVAFGSTACIEATPTEESDPTDVNAKRPTADVEPDGETPDGSMLDGPPDTPAPPPDAAVEWEEIISEVRLVRVILVLDYSGSMNASDVADGRSRSALLREAVVGILDLQALVAYGLVQFSSNVFNTVSPSWDPTHDVIREGIQAHPGGLTNYEAALLAAERFLTEAGGRGLVLFVADGIPNAGQDPVRVAARIRDSGHTILATAIGNFPGRDLMVELAGTAENPGSWDFYVDFDGVHPFVELIDQIIGSVLCSTEPLDNAPTHPGPLAVWLRSWGGEVPLPRVARNVDLADEHAFYYLPDENRLVLARPTCLEMLSAGAELMVRGVE